MRRDSNVVHVFSAAGIGMIPYKKAPKAEAIASPLAHVKRLLNISSLKLLGKPKTEQYPATQT